MDELQLLVDLHRPMRRQGPGSPEDSQRALALAAPAAATPRAVADIGCGTGAASLLLAQALDAEVTAVDILPAFTDELRRRAAQAGLGGRIRAVTASMDALPFRPGQFDLLWSEGAIYNMGFENGIRAWRQFLCPGGALVLSEITWTRDQRPAELEAYWHAAYPEIATAGEKIALLEKHGYSLLGYFVLPERSWLEHYYRPLQASFPAFLRRQQHSETARALVAAEEQEIALYRRHSDYYSYGMYIARRP